MSGSGRTTRRWSRPYQIAEIVVFGSYLHPEATVGDLEVAFRRFLKSGSGAAEMLAYADASGRRFGSFRETLSFADREVSKTVRGTSPYVSVTPEDIREFANGFVVVYANYPADRTPTFAWRGPTTKQE